MRAVSSTDPGMRFDVVLVHASQLIQLGTLLVQIQRSGRRMKVENRIASRAEHGSLIGGRQKAGAPVRRTGERAAARVLNHNERRKVLVLAAQTISDPRTDAGVTGDESSRCSIRKCESV